MKTDNTIIAAFMGIADEIETGATSLIQIEGITGYYKNDNLKFHTDWNWLMEVVKKIESLGYRVTIVRHICRIDLTEESKLIISEDIKKIEAVYSACLEFIKWYNKQNQ